MSYTAESISVLKGLEPVRHRPGMYTRTDCPLHIIQEAIDNAADEALGGYCKRIAVTLHSDASVSIQDDGRGIPVEVHPIEKVPTVEVVFTQLHAGGKFNKADGSSAYRFSGGLHGVGVSVTNALSTRLEVEVTRDGGRFNIVFSGGAVVEPLQRIADAPKRPAAPASESGRMRASSTRPASRSVSSNACCAARLCSCRGWKYRWPLKMARRRAGALPMACSNTWPNSSTAN